MAGQVVVLVPGFMGFGRLGGLYYFTDRVLSTVRGALEALLDRAFPVVGVRTDPVGSLVSRQTFLLRELAALEERMGEPVLFHLVGHSTGGVDAELLTCTRPLEGSEWGPYADLRRRIASVTTIAAPHYGTSLADSAAAGWLLHPWSIPGSIESARLVASLLGLLASRTLTWEGVEAVLLDAPGSAEFTARFLTHRRLLLDLQPSRMIELRQTNPPALDVPVRCFATFTPPVQIQGVPRACDGFFATTHELTAKYADRRDPAETARFLPALGGAPCIANPAAQPPRFQPDVSDGIVDSARQVLETHAPGRNPAAALAAVVLGDHGDVLGYYDRQDALQGGRPLDQSFFRSGSGFGDDQFFELWNEVAEHVAEVAAPHADLLPRSSARGPRPVSPAWSLP